jgi:hypothetical protein
MHNQMLFMARMTLLDSIDSVPTQYSYTGFPEQHSRLFESIQEYDAPEEYGPYREACDDTCPLSCSAAATTGK